MRKLFDILANMGVFIRLNDPRHDPVTEVGRSWGEPRDGLAISLQAVNADTLSVLLKNLGTEARVLRIPAWLNFYSVAALDGNGVAAQLKPYGRSVLHDPINTALVDRTLPAGKSASTEIPLAALFDLHAGPYRISVSTPTLRSNEITLVR